MILLPIGRLTAMIFCCPLEAHRRGGFDLKWPVRAYNPEINFMVSGEHLVIWWILCYFIFADQGKSMQSLVVSAVRALYGLLAVHLLLCKQWEVRKHDIVQHFICS